MNTRLKLSLLSLLLLLCVNCAKNDDSVDNNGLLGITTNLITDIKQTSALSGGELINGTSEPILAKGLVWDTNPGPTLEDHFTDSGSGTGSFESKMTNLSLLSTYYVRAYVTTFSQTFYGNELSFTTLDHNVLVIFPSSILLANQSHVNNFGAQGYSKVVGKITIEEESPNAITSLAPLECLLSVGFEDINSVSSALVINNNQGLTNLNGLQNLDMVRGTLEIRYNSNLNQLTGLEGLREITGGMIIEDENGQLQDLQGLNGLEIIRNDFFLIGPSLVNFNGLENLTIMEQSFHFWGGSSFQNFQGLNSLGQVGNSFQLNYFSGTFSFDGLSSLSHVGGYFSVLDCDNVTSMEGLESLNTVGNLEIIGCDALSSLQGLNNLSLIDGNLSIKANTNLTNFCSLQTFLSNGGLIGGYSVSDNAFNPTLKDIINGNCSL